LTTELNDIKKAVKFYELDRSKPKALSTQEKVSLMELAKIEKTKKVEMGLGRKF